MNRKIKFSLICLIFLILASHSFAEVDLSELFENIHPAVVTVITFDKNKKPLGQGSGFFIDAYGHLITNYHVLKGASHAEVRAYDGNRYQINSVIGEDRKMDLIKVLVDIPSSSVQWVNATGALPSIAERVIVIGSPMGLELTVSEGIVSSVREIPDLGKILQISAAISPGSSGGPVVNMKGQVIGVVSFYLTKGQNLNFAIPAKYLFDLKPSRTVKTISEWTYGVDKKATKKSPRKGRFFVQADPKGARVRILNIKPKFYQGIALIPGPYHIEMSADGYEMKKFWIKIGPGEDKDLIISLKKLPQQGRLFVLTEPKGARVQILNMKSKFYQGIQVKSGPYHIEVSADGFESGKIWIKIVPGEDKKLNISLKKLPRQGRLYVRTEPEGAKILIPSIGPKFYQGIELDEGSYQVVVAAAAHETQALRVALRAGEEKTVNVKLKPKKFTNSLGMKFVHLPAGSFLMGSPSGEKDRGSDEKQHQVTLTRGFYIQTTEVTQGQWKAVMGNNPSQVKSCGDNCPVERVSWSDVQDFIRKLNSMEGTDKYRLPTEAEWEYAARAGSSSAYSFGNNSAQLSAYAWYSGNRSSMTHSVGQKKPNAWGLYDMHGNVWEWCQDWYGEYPSGSVTDPTGLSGGSRRVVRGGSWTTASSLRPRAVRCALRGRYRSDFKAYDLGFRLLRTK